MISNNPLLEFSWADLLDAGTKTVNTVAKATDRKDFGNNYSYSSAAKAASNLIAVFPVLCSSSLSRDTAAMVTKAIERKATVILQLAISATTMTNLKNGMEYLRQFHQNLNAGGLSGDDLIQSFNQYVSDNVDPKTGEWNDNYLFPKDESYHISTETKNHFVRLLMESYNTWYDEDINPSSLNDFLIQESSQGFNVSFRPFVLSEAKRKNVDPNKSVIYDYYSNNNTGQSHTHYHTYQSNRDFNDPNYREQEKQKADEAKNKAAEAKARAEEAKNRADQAKSRSAEYDRIAKAKADEAEAKAAEAKTRADQAKFNYDRQQKKEENKYSSLQPPMAELKDNDVKKMNEMVPSLMVVRFYNVDSNKQNEFIIGIKSKCIKANADEIFKKIYNNNRDGKGLVNFIRATSGEIKFVRDLFLGLDQAKSDVMSMNKKGSNEDVWHMLQIRAQNAKGYLRQNKTNYASAITTVVITQEDADYLYKQMNIDINNPKIAMQFMKSYNLLGFAIVDDTTESAKFLWDDGDLKFEELSYTMLEREDRDSNYKKVVNLLSKMR